MEAAGKQLSWWVILVNHDSGDTACILCWSLGTHVMCVLSLSRGNQACIAHREFAITADGRVIMHSSCVRLRYADN